MAGDNKTQFLTDEEYESIRKDMYTIIGEINNGWDFLSSDYASNSAQSELYRINKQQELDTVAAKLTAYVDQKVKRYY